MIELKTITPPVGDYGELGELGELANWRNDERVRPALRTGKLTFSSQQVEWANKVYYDNTCSYYFIYYNKILVGYCGLDKISFENKTAEISLLINPDEHRQGHGMEAVILLLDIAFDKLKLKLIYAEVNDTTSAIEFWLAQGFMVEAFLKDRKFWKGKFYNSTILNIEKEDRP